MLWNKQHTARARKRQDKADRKARSPRPVLDVSLRGGVFVAEEGLIEVVDAGV